MTVRFGGLGSGTGRPRSRAASTTPRCEVAWDRASRSIVCYSLHGAEAMPLPEENPPDVMVVDSGHTVWVQFGGRLYALPAETQE